MKKPPKHSQRELAKLAMTASLGLTVITALFMKGKMAKRLHTGAGIALVASSIWHHQLYQPVKPSKEVREFPVGEENRL